MTLLIATYIYLLYGAYTVGGWVEMPSVKEQIVVLQNISYNIGRIALFLFILVLIVFWPVPYIHVYLTRK